MARWYRGSQNSEPVLLKRLSMMAASTADAASVQSMRMMKLLPVYKSRKQYKNRSGLMRLSLRLGLRFVR